jgi:hypothetical protein
LAVETLGDLPLPRDSRQGPSDSSGPTLLLNRGQGKPAGNRVAEFMYFVALISPEPVSVEQSPENTQRAHLVSVRRRDTGNSFLIDFEFRFAGQGYQRNIFDHTEKIRQQERKLKDGGVLDHQLASINVEGPGKVNVEVCGAIMDGVTNVAQVRLHFSADGQPSPVSIDLHDVRYVNGVLQEVNQTVAKVNTLTFRRQPGPAKMEVTVASIRRKASGDSAWESVLGKVKATAVNLILPPVDIDKAGRDAMLRFGLALASGAPTYTFPRAAHLKL